MRFGKIKWLAWVLVMMMLFGSVQAWAFSSADRMPRGFSRITVPSLHPAESLTGVEKIVSNKKIIYKFRGPFSVSDKRLAKRALTAKASIKSISMNPMESTMGMDDTYNVSSKIQPILLNISPISGTFGVTGDDVDSETFSITITGNPGVFELVTDKDDFLYLAALKTGTATVTIKTRNGKKASKTITVKDTVLFSSMTVSEMISKSPYKQATVKSKTMSAGDSAWLMAQPRPYTATYYDYPYYEYYTYSTSAVTFTSSNEKVATVSPYGDLYALSPGKATITATARDGSKKKYSFPLTVKAASPTGFYLSAVGSGTLKPGTTRQIKTNFSPANYYDQRVTWTSSDPSVATVDANGLVTAVSPYSTKTPGSNSAIITGKTKMGGLTSALNFTVTYDKALTGTTYRFYGIGNDNYDEADLKLTSCVNDMNVMADAASAAGFALVDRNKDLGFFGITGVLNHMATNSSIGEDDVTVFFYSGHGAGSSNQNERGALCATDGDIVTVDQVQSYLDRVPGTVVVILDSCLSGQYITAKSPSPAKRLAAAKAFNSAWVSKLASSKATNFSSKALTTSSVKSKYKILTASESLEYSSGSADTTGFGWFTKWVATGIGRVPNLETGSSTAGNLEADANNDKVVSLKELYNYVSVNLPTDTEYAWWDPIGQQHTQVWPANDNFPVINEYVAG